MKYPASHYPNSGIQHTRAVFALFVTIMFHEMYVSRGGIKIETRMKNLAQAVNSCSVLTKKKALSAGGNRAFNNALLTIKPYIEGNSANRKQAEKRFCSLAWCALTFVEDVINTCPQYTAGQEGQKWKKLHSILSEIADKLFSVYPKLDEEGTMFYEMAAWAMEDVEFPPDDRLCA